MIFIPAPLPGAFLITLEFAADERGFSARAWSAEEFKNHGLNPKVVQCDISFNKHSGTLRGMHYQQVPHQQATLMRCTQGTIYDVIVDLRLESPAYKQSFGAVLSASNRRMVYAPEGFGHGFLTLEEDTEVFYQISEYYLPDFCRGFRWNDPAFNIQWPARVNVISEHDRDYPDFISL